MQRGSNPRTFGRNTINTRRKRPPGSSILGGRFVSVILKVEKIEG